MTPSPTEAFQSPKLHEIPKFIRIKSRNKTSHLERDLPPLKKEIEKQLYTN